MLRKMLAQSSGCIRVAAREAHFFESGRRAYNLGLQWYIDRMPPTSRDEITLEKTPQYFTDDLAPRRIHDMNSSIKLILILCDPTERLISDYCEMKFNAERHNRSFPSNFKDAIFDKSGMLNVTYEPVRVGLYSEHLKRWYSIFPKSQILILHGENFIEQPWQELNKVMRFLNIKKRISKEIFMFDKQKGFYCFKQPGYQNCREKVKGRVHPKISKENYKLIQNIYGPANDEFTRLTGLNFSWGHKQQIFRNKDPNGHIC